MKYFKLMAFIIVISSFILMSLPLFPLLIFFKTFTRKRLISIVSVTSQMMLKVLGIKVDYKISPVFNQHSNYLIVANHLSYLDIIILSAKFPSCFVTSKEVKATFGLGQLSILSGCLYVDRKNKQHLKDEIIELRTALSEGMNVIVFPEATSTNGEEILRFRKPLFEAAIATQKKILPITINYLKINSQEITRSNRDIVYWYGEMTFVSHFFKVLNQKRITVEINAAEPFLPEVLSSIDLAIKSHQIVKSNYKVFSHHAMEAL